MAGPTAAFPAYHDKQQVKKTDDCGVVAEVAAAYRMGLYQEPLVVQVTASRHGGSVRRLAGKTVGRKICLSPACQENKS